MTASPWPSPVAIAHRGSRYLWPENTMEAFSAAVGLGYRHVETDLHASSDGVVVCHHDRSVDRTTDGSGPISGFTFRELSRLDAGYRHRVDGEHPFRGRGVRIPRLEDVVAAFPELSFVVDLKSDSVVDPLVDLIDRCDLQQRLIVGSFADARLVEFRRKTGGGVPTSTGSRESLMWYLASRIGRTIESAAVALQLPSRRNGLAVVDQPLVDTAHRAGMPVHVWTVSTPSDISNYLDMGVDGIVTDRPDVLKEILLARRDWSA